MNETGFNAIGKPVPFFRQEAGYCLARSLGLSTEESHTLVRSMAEKLEKDKPFEAQEIAMKYVDLTGYYRIVSVLLTHEGAYNGAGN